MSMQAAPASVAVQAAPVPVSVRAAPPMQRRQFVQTFPVDSEHGQWITQQLENQKIEVDKPEPEAPYLPIGPLAQMANTHVRSPSRKNLEMPTDWHGRQVGVHEVSWRDYLDKHEVGVFSRQYKSLDNKQHCFYDLHAPEINEGSHHHRHHLHKPPQETAWQAHYNQFATKFCPKFFPA